MRVADFFCGGGGFSEGFRQAGFDIVFAVDKWEPAVITYKGNKPGVNVHLDDVLRISNLPDDEFERLIPDSEVIIGSPPCQSFSNSNKSGNSDKSLGIQLIEAYLKIIARKKYKENSVLRYWILENVPNVRNYIKEEYSAADLGLSGDFLLRTCDGASGIYNAKYYGAPTNRERYLCGEFPEPQRIRDDSNVTTLGDVLKCLGNPGSECKKHIWDVNYPTLNLPRKEVTDHHYVYELAPYEWETCKRLKQDKGYMGKMAFPENIQKPARTVMATMSASSRETMVLAFGDNHYRLPTVREAATMMSFPIDYWFYGESRGIKHTLVGNAVPPKMSYALAIAIANAENETIPTKYIPIVHDLGADKPTFYNLNGVKFDVRKEPPKRKASKFKYHIPYLIIDAYRVELTNYKSDFDNENYFWKTEIHYSQGKNKAKCYDPIISMRAIPSRYKDSIRDFINQTKKRIPNMNEFQTVFCMTAESRSQQKYFGPYELLESIKAFIEKTIPPEEQRVYVQLGDNLTLMPLAIAVGYLILKRIVKYMGRSQ